MSSETLLVTGANGFIGRALVLALNARGHVMHDSAVDPLATFRHANMEGPLNLARQFFYQMDISRAYPYFALGFVFVPLLGAWLFGEALSLRYGLGVIMILAGVVLTSSP